MKNTTSGDLKQQIESHLTKETSISFVGDSGISKTELERITEPSKKITIYSKKEMSLVSMILKCNHIWYWDNNHIRSVRYQIPNVEKDRLKGLENKDTSGHTWQAEISKGVYLIDTDATKTRKVYLPQILRIYKDNSSCDYFLISHNTLFELQRKREFERRVRLCKSGEVFNRRKLEVEQLWNNAKKIADERIAKETEIRVRLGKKKNEIQTSTDVDLLVALPKSKALTRLIKQEVNLQKAGKT